MLLIPLENVPYYRNEKQGEKNEVPCVHPGTLLRLMPTPVCSASPGECKDPRIPVTQLPWGWERAEAEGALVQMKAIVS